MSENQNESVDLANEPVDVDEDAVTDTGVLHEDKPKPVRGTHATREEVDGE